MKSESGFSFSNGYPVLCRFELYNVMREQVGWNVGHNLSIGGRELEYSGTHLKGIVTDVQVSKLTILKSYLGQRELVQAFSRVISAEEAVAYTTCSKAG